VSWFLAEDAYLYIAHKGSAVQYQCTVKKKVNKLLASNS